MEQESSVNIPFLALTEFMGEGLRTNVIKSALRNYREQKGEAHRRLDVAIRNVIDVKGFRDATRAPLFTLQKEVVEASKSSNNILGNILQVWAISNPKLEEITRNYLIQKNIPARDTKEEWKGFKDRWPQSQIEEMAEEIQKANPDIDFLAAWLMLCCLSGIVPKGDREEEDLGSSGEGEDKVLSGERQKMIWDSWIKELRKLPAWAEEWEKIEDFITEVRALSSAKKQEFFEPYEELQKSLKQMLEQQGNLLEYFGFMDVGEWKSSQCKFDEISECVQNLEMFSHLLSEHLHERNKPTPILEEERKKRLALGALEEKINDLYKKLKSKFEVKGPAPSKAYQESPPPEIESSIPPETAAKDSTDEEKARPITQGGLEKRVKEPGRPQEREESTPQKPVGGEAGPEKAHKAIKRISLQGLISAREAAELVRTEKKPENWELFCWALVAEDDLAGAFWLDKSLTQMGYQMPIPAWLICSCYLFMSRKWGLNWVTLFWGYAV